MKKRKEMGHCSGFCLEQGGVGGQEMNDMRRPEERHGGEDGRKIPFETC